MTNGTAPGAQTALQERTTIRVAVLCGIVVVLEGYDLSTLGYVVPTLAELWTLPPAAFTAALTAGNVGMLLGALSCGWLGDLWGRKPVLLGCVTAFGVASAATAFVSTTAELTIARLITGIGLGGGIPLCIALVSDCTPRHRQGATVIAMISGVVVGNLLAGLVAASVLARYGWPAIFLIGGVLPLVMLPFLAIMLPESPALLQARVPGAANVGAPRSRVLALFSSGLARVTVLLWAINFLNLLTIYFVNSWLPAVLRSMGASAQNAIIATSMFHVGAIVAAFVSARLVGRYGIERVLSVMLAVGGSCILLTGLLDLAVLGIAMLVLGFGFGTNGSQLGISALPGAIYRPLIRSTGAGWATGFGRLGNISGALLGGLLLSLGWTPRRMLLLLAIAPFVSAALMFLLHRARAAGQDAAAATTPSAAQPATN